MKQLLGAWVFVVVLMGCVQIAIRRDLSISREAPNAGLDDSSISVARAGVAVRELPYVQNIPLAGWGAYLWFHFRPASSNDAPNRHLKTRVLVLEDPQHQKVALITTDLHGGSRYITEYVAKRLSGRGFHAGNIFLSATHNHSGPGGLYASPYFDALMSSTALVGSNKVKNRVAFNKELADAIGNTIIDAINEADDNLTPAQVGFVQAYVGNTINRSTPALLNNFENQEARALAAFAKAFPVPDSSPTANTVERRGVDGNVYGVAAFRADGGEMLGMFATVNAHCSLLDRNNKIQSADYFGEAASYAEAGLTRDGGAPSPVIALAAGAQGDVDPMADELDATAKDADLQMRVGRLYDQLNKQRETDATFVLVKKYGETLGKSLIQAATNRKTQKLQSVRVAFSEKDISQAVKTTAMFGKAGVAGSEFGRGPQCTAFAEGPTNPENPDLAQRPKDTRKCPLVYAPPLGAANRFLEEQDEHFPIRLVELQLESDARIRLLGLPGEPTSWLGHTLKLKLGADDRSKSMIVGVTGDYQGYLTTALEYDVQQYEGGSTMWGRNTESFLLDEVEALTRVTSSDAGIPPPEGVAHFAYEKETWLNHLNDAGVGCFGPPTIAVCE